MLLEIGGTSKREIKTKGEFCDWCLLTLRQSLKKLFELIKIDFRNDFVQVDQHAVGDVVPQHVVFNGRRHEASRRRRRPRRRNGRLESGLRDGRESLLCRKEDHLARGRAQEVLRDEARV